MEFKNIKLEKFNQKLKKSKIAVIGLGVSNLPLVNYLCELDAEITVFDNRKKEEIDSNILDNLIEKGVQFSLGKDNLKKLSGFDIIFRSPSCRPDIPEVQAEVKKGAYLTSEIEQVLELAPCKIIGVTGSDGKTTTTSLIYEIVKAKGYKCYLGGNIGTPLFNKIQDMKPDDIVVLELSSFQLMNMSKSPNISVITNITPNHLDIHKSYEEYIEAKKNIFLYQEKDDILVLNHEDEITKKFVEEAQATTIFFSKNKKIKNGFYLENENIIDGETKEIILNVKEVKLRGKHNYENICTALSATKTLVDIKTAVQAVKKFNGVEHRLEFVREIEGVKWYNDSIGSSPTRTIAGLNSFEENIVLIAGGYDKNLDYEPLAEPIIKKVSTLVLLGQTAKKIENAVKTMTGFEKLEIINCKTLEEAVNKAHQCSKKGEIVLFSPASASFDMFKNFMERGEKFKNLVKKI